MKLPPKISAGIAAVLFAVTLGVLIVVAAFGFIRLMEEMSEGLGILPTRWGENNPDVMFQIAALSAIPVMAWFLVWFYKKALVSETALQNYRYTPPDPPKQAGKA